MLFDTIKYGKHTNILVDAIGMAWVMWVTLKTLQLIN